MAIKNKPGFTPPKPVPMTFTDPAIDSKWWRWEFLAFLVRQNGWTKGAELGLWDGRTMFHLLGACPDLSMTGVDLWAAQPSNPGHEDYVGWDHADHERLCRDRLARFGERSTIIKGWTSEAAEKVDNGSLDFVFIDADHSEASVRDDIATWLPKLKPTGWIIGHDIDWAGVKSAVEDLMPGYEVGPNVTWVRPVNPDASWPMWKD